jgi:DNA polymerase
MKFTELEKEISGCDRCGLCKTRKNTVVGKGSKEAKLMFVGEAPGEQEDLQGSPFVGPAGQLLDEYLTACDIPADAVYICDILKCRPPHNRDPLPEEEDACMDYLRRQVRLIRPKIIVCLGRIAAKRMIDADFRITANHGKWYEKGAFRMMAVYHPSALLRDPAKREDMLKDMMQIKKALDEI